MDDFQDPNRQYTPDEYEEELAKKYGVPLKLLRAMTGQESGGNQTGANGSVVRSGAGARGRYQLMPRTAQELGVNPDDPFDNIYGGIKYLKQGYDKASQYFPDERSRWAAAITRYHAGDLGLNQAIKTGEVPDMLDKSANITTREHVRRIMDRWDQDEGFDAESSDPLPTDYYEGIRYPAKQKLATKGPIRQEQPQGFAKFADPVRDAISQRIANPPAVPEPHRYTPSGVPMRYAAEGETARINEQQKYEDEVTKQEEQRKAVTGRRAAMGLIGGLVTAPFGERQPVNPMTAGSALSGFIGGAAKPARIVGNVAKKLGAEGDWTGWGSRVAKESAEEVAGATTPAEKWAGVGGGLVGGFAGDAPLFATGMNGILSTALKFGGAAAAEHLDEGAGRAAIEGVKSGATMGAMAGIGKILPPAIKTLRRGKEALDEQQAFAQEAAARAVAGGADPVLAARAAKEAIYDKAKWPIISSMAREVLGKRLLSAGAVGSVAAATEVADQLITSGKVNPEQVVTSSALPALFGAFAPGSAKLSPESPLRRGWVPPRFQRPEGWEPAGLGPAGGGPKAPREGGWTYTEEDVRAYNDALRRGQPPPGTTARQTRPPQGVEADWIRTEPEVQVGRSRDAATEPRVPPEQKSQSVKVVEPTDPPEVVPGKWKITPADESGRSIAYDPRKVTENEALTIQQRGGFPPQGLAPEPQQPLPIKPPFAEQPARQLPEGLAAVLGRMFTARPVGTETPPTTFTSTEPPPNLPPPQGVIPGGAPMRAPEPPRATMRPFAPPPPQMPAMAMPPVAPASIAPSVAPPPSAGITDADVQSFARRRGLTPEVARQQLEQMLAEDIAANQKAGIPPSAPSAPPKPPPAGFKLEEPEVKKTRPTGDTGNYAQQFYKGQGEELPPIEGTSKPQFSIPSVYSLPEVHKMLGRLPENPTPKQVHERMREVIAARKGITAKDPLDLPSLSTATREEFESLFKANNLGPNTRAGQALKAALDKGEGIITERRAAAAAKQADYESRLPKQEGQPTPGPENAPQASESDVQARLRAFRSTYQYQHQTEAIKDKIAAGKGANLVNQVRNLRELGAGAGLPPEVVDREVESHVGRPISDFAEEAAPTRSNKPRDFEELYQKELASQAPPSAPPAPSAPQVGRAPTYTRIQKPTSGRVGRSAHRAILDFGKIPYSIAKKHDLLERLPKDLIGSKRAASRKHAGLDDLLTHMRERGFMTEIDPATAGEREVLDWLSENAAKLKETYSEEAEPSKINRQEGAEYDRMVEESYNAAARDARHRLKLSEDESWNYADLQARAEGWDTDEFETREDAPGGRQTIPAKRIRDEYEKARKGAPRSIEKFVRTAKSMGVPEKAAKDLLRADREPPAMDEQTLADLVSNWDESVPFELAGDVRIVNDITGEIAKTPPATIAFKPDVWGTPRFSIEGKSNEQVIDEIFRDARVRFRQTPGRIGKIYGNEQAGELIRGILTALEVPVPAFHGIAFPIQRARLIAMGFEDVFSNPESRLDEVGKATSRQMAEAFSRAVDAAMERGDGAVMVILTSNPETAEVIATGVQSRPLRYIISTLRHELTHEGQLRAIAKFNVYEGPDPGFMRWDEVKKDPLAVRALHRLLQKGYGIDRMTLELELLAHLSAHQYEELRLTSQEAEDLMERSFRRIVQFAGREVLEEMTYALHPKARRAYERATAETAEGIRSNTGTPGYAGEGQGGGTAVPELRRAKTQLPQRTEAGRIQGGVGRDEANLPSTGGDRKIPSLLQRAEKEPERGIAPVYYSALQRFADALPVRDRMTGSQWLNRLKKPQTGIKPDEIRWTGLESHLKATGDRLVPAQEIRDFVKANAIELQVDVRGGPADTPERARLAAARETRDKASTDEAMAWSDVMFEARRAWDMPWYWAPVEQEKLHPRWDDLQSLRNLQYLWAEGGDVAGKFAERSAVLDRLFPETDNVSEDLRDSIRHWRARAFAYTEAVREYTAVGDAAKKIEPKHKGWKLEMEGVKPESYTELVFRLPKDPVLQLPEERKKVRNHYEPDAIAHARMQEYTVESGPHAGKTVLNVSEVQSDLFQAARKHGATSREVIARREEATKALQWHERLRDRMREAWEKSRGEYSAFVDKAIAEQQQRFEGLDLENMESYEERIAALEAHNARWDDVRKEMDEMQAKSNRLYGEYAQQTDVVNTLKEATRAASTGVPEAPLEKQWPILVMKQIIRTAVDRGDDIVAWDPGIAQVDRYQTEMRQRVRSIVYAPAGNGLVQLTVYKPSGESTVQSLPLEGEGYFGGYKADLDEVLGKEMAAEVRGNLRQGKGGSFEGDDLVIGGQGMTGFYDKRYVNEVADYIKPMGGKMFELPVKVRSKEYKLHAFEITPQMKEVALHKGQPLFDIKKGEERDVSGVVAKAFAPVYYSALEQFVNKLPATDKMTGEQWLNRLKKPQSGIKPDELKWTGLEEFLSTPSRIQGYLENPKPEVFTPKDIQEYLKSPAAQATKLEIEYKSQGALKSEYAELNALSAPNGPIQRAVERANKALDDLDEALNEWSRKLTNALWVELHRRVVRQRTLVGDRTFATPGWHVADVPRPGFTYGPTWKDTSPEAKAALKDLIDKVEEAVSIGYARVQEQAEIRAKIRTQGPRYAGTEYRLRGGVDYFEFAIRAPKAGISYKAKQHFTPDTIAHGRGQTIRVGGENVLNISEVQSDLHQAARSEGGYLDANNRAELKEKVDRLKDQIAVRRIRLNEALRESTVPRDPAQRLAAQQRYKDIAAEVEEMEDERAELGSELSRRPQPAPFEKQWPMLVIKRMIREAAERGVDRIAWDPGLAQIDRYSSQLRRRVSKIEYAPATPETMPLYLVARHRPQTHVRLLVTARGGDIPYKGVIVPLEGKEFSADYDTDISLDMLLGKEMAAKVRADVAAGQAGVFEGEGLLIGGKGMTGFYDKRLVNDVNDYVKQWGVKVEELPIREAPDEFDQAGEMYNLHSVRITPEMKESALYKGQPLFQLGDKVRAMVHDADGNPRPMFLAQRTASGGSGGRGAGGSGGGGGNRPPRPPGGPEEPPQPPLWDDLAPEDPSLYPSVGQKLSAYQVSAHLFRPRFVIRNLAGHAGMATMETWLVDGISAMIDRTYSNITGAPRQIADPSFEQFKALWTGAQQTARGRLKGRFGVEDPKLKSAIWKSLKKMGQEGGGDRSLSFGGQEISDEALRQVYGTLGAMMGLPVGKIAKGKTIGRKIGGIVADGLFFGNELPDAMMKGGYYAAALHNLEKIYQGARMTGVTIEQLQEQAMAEALVAALQDPNFISNGLKILKRTLNRMSTGGRSADFGAGDFLIKYTQIPGALAKRGLEYSFLGFAQVAHELQWYPWQQGGWKYQRAMKAYKEGRQTVRPELPGGVKAGFERAKEAWNDETYRTIDDKDIPIFRRRNATKAFARAVIGSGMGVGIGTFLTIFGMMTGAEDEDPNRAKLDRDQGFQPYAVNLSAIKRLFQSGLDLSLWSKKEGPKIHEGDYLVSVDWFQPWGAMLATGAAFGMALLGRGPAKKVATAGASTVAGSFEKAMRIISNLGEAGVGSLAAFTDALSDTTVLKSLTRYTAQAGRKSVSPARAIWESVKEMGKDIPASLTPTILNDVRVTLDNAARETTDRSGGIAGAFRTAMNRAKAKVPGLAQTLPVRQDTFGQAIKRPTDEMRDVVGPVKIPGLGRVINTALNPATQTRFHTTPFSEAMRSADRTVGPPKIQPGEAGASYAERKSVKAQLAGKAGEALVGSDFYKQAEPDLQKKMVEIFSRRLSEGADIRPQAVWKSARESLRNDQIRALRGPRYQEQAEKMKRLLQQYEREQ